MGVRLSQRVAEEDKDSFTRLLPESERGGLLTVKEVAEPLDVCGATIYRLCDRGELPHIRITTTSIRIRPADLVAFVEARRC